MTGLKVKRVVWTIVFLGITLAAIAMEVVAGVFHPAGSIPWTEYLVRYVPWPVQLVAYVVLVVWLPFHFWRHDHMRKAAYVSGHADAVLEMAVSALHGRDSAEAAAERALWTRDVADILRGQTAAPAEMLPGLAYAADFLDPPNGRPSPLGAFLRVAGAIGPDQDAKVNGG